MVKQKLTRLEKHWILYDVGNSAFTLIIATSMPIYFNYRAEQAGIGSVEYLAFWGYAAAISTLLVALGGPVLGTIADNRGYKKPVFIIALLVGALGCLLLGLAGQWLMFLVIFVVAKVGYSASLIFYDAMLTDVTTPERMDKVSALGYAWGYIGSCLPFLLCLGLVLGAESLHLSMSTAMGAAFLITSLWWVGMTLPLLKNYRQKYYVEHQDHAVARSFSRLWETLHGLRRDPKVLWFLIAFFFYIDGVYTIIDMATAYGSALGLDTTGLLLALLATQVVAFPCSIGFSILVRRVAADRLITICIGAYFAIAVFAMFMSTQLHFWILAVLVGMFQGGIQALSRSYFARIIPSEKSGEYFGMLDICGKGAAFLGTTLVSVLSQLTGSINQGVGSIALMFIVGMICFRRAVREKKREQQ